ASAQPRLESNFDLLAVVSVEEVAQALRDSPILDTGDRERPRRVVHIGHSVALEQLQLLYLRVRHQLGAGQLFGVVGGVKLSDRGSHDKGVASRHGPYSLLTYSSTAGISPLSVLTVAGCTRCAYPAPVRLNSAVILGSNSSSRSTAAPWSPPSTITTRHSPDHAAPGPRSPRSNNTHAEPARIARGWSTNAVIPPILFGTSITRCRASVQDIPTSSPAALGPELQAAPLPNPGRTSDRNRPPHRGTTGRAEAPAQAFWTPTAAT